MLYLIFLVSIKLVVEPHLLIVNVLKGNLTNIFLIMNKKNSFRSFRKT